MEVKQHNYLQIVHLTIDTPIYTHNPYLIRCQSNDWVTVLYIATSDRKHTWIIVNQLKYIHHHKYEILREENTLSTHKLCDEPFSAFSSCLMC